MMRSNFVLSAPVASLGRPVARIRRAMRRIRVRGTGAAEAGSGRLTLLEGVETAPDGSTAVVFVKAPRPPLGSSGASGKHKCGPYKTAAQQVGHCRPPTVMQQTE